jgi:septal ring factor EnvC (AmiA/AmiB activator)
MSVIKREMAEAEKKEKDRLAKQKSATKETTVKTENKNTKSTGKVSAVEGGLTKTAGDRPYSALETTEEGREASISIENSKGALPWPVDKGNIFVHFGVENIPGTKLNRNADYIEIAVPKGSSVKSVANGIVKYTGDINGDLTIIIQHGKYFTMSSHLSSTSVSVGQEVKAVTVLGKSGINLEGEGSLLFILSKEGKNLDPESWLRNRR